MNLAHLTSTSTAVRLPASIVAEIADTDAGQRYGLSGIYDETVIESRVARKVADATPTSRSVVRVVLTPDEIRSLSSSVGAFLAGWKDRAGEDFGYYGHRIKAARNVLAQIPGPPRYY